VPILRDVVIPVVSAYALLIAVVFYAVRHPDAERPRERRVGWRPRLRLIAVTVAGGYACFLAIVLVFHVWIAGQLGALSSAIRGGAFLAVIAAMTFVFGSGLERIHGRRSLRAR
jgi:hypothetical protein